MTARLGSNQGWIHLHPLAFVSWRSRSSESREPDHCRFHLLPIMPLSRLATRSCSGPWEAKWPSVGVKATGTLGGREGRMGKKQKGFGSRDAVRGSQSKPRAGSRLTVGTSKLVQANCQKFLSVLISSARANKTNCC